MDIKNQKSIPPLLSLRRRWFLYAVLSSFAFGIEFLYFKNFWQIDLAFRWLLTTSIVFGFLLVFFWRSLPRNYRLGEENLLPTLGPGNSLSLIRGALISMVAGFLFLPIPSDSLAWLPMVFYLMAGLTDFLDGYLARISDHVTLLGEDLDMQYDSLGVLVATLLAFQYGAVPWWYAIFGFARYIYLLGIWIRRKMELPIFQLQPSMSRRIIASVQMGFITVMLVPIIGSPGTIAAATLFLGPFMFRFIIDWYQVIGRWDQEAGVIQGWESVASFAKNWLPVWLRLVAVGALGYGLLNVFADFDVTALVYLEKEMMNPSLSLVIFGVLELLYLLMILLGAAGRTTAILVLITAGIKLQFDAFDLPYQLLLVSSFGILFLGTGKYSLWKPEEWVIYHWAGE